MDKSLKNEFDKLHRKSRSIPSVPYMSPVSDNSFIIGLIGGLTLSINPVVGGEWKDFPWFSGFRPDRTLSDMPNNIKQVGSQSLHRV